MRLIDADALEAKQKTIYMEFDNVAMPTRVISTADLHLAPTIDAVEVVRCIDCKHSAIDAYAYRRMCIRNGEIRPNGRIWFGTAVNDDHFCGYVVNVDTEANDVQT